MQRAREFAASYLSQMLIDRMQGFQNGTSWVRTRCLGCGGKLFLEVSLDLEEALYDLYTLDDDSDFCHNGHCCEDGVGWGVVFQLDRVMEAVFGPRHMGPCWPPPEWSGDLWDVPPDDSVVQVPHWGASL